MYPNGGTGSRRALINALYLGEKILDTSKGRNTRGAWYLAAMKTNVRVSTTLNLKGLIVTRIE